MLSGSEVTRIRLLARENDAPTVRELYNRAADYVALEQPQTPIATPSDRTATLSTISENGIL